MTTLTELFRQGNHEELWQKCCGFIDLSLDEFMTIQERLLKEQLTLLKKCELGRNIMGDANPENIAEFRDSVPLTTYDNYAPYLLKRGWTYYQENQFYGSILPVNMESMLISGHR